MIQYDYEYDLTNHPYRSEFIDANSGILSQTFTIPSGVSAMKGIRVRLSKNGNPGPLEWSITRLSQAQITEKGIIQAGEVTPVLERMVGEDFPPVPVHPGEKFAINLRVLSGKAPLDAYRIYGPNTRTEQVDEPNARIPYWWYESTDIRLDDVNAPLPLAYAGAGYPDYPDGQRTTSSGERTWSISFQILTDLDQPQTEREQQFEFAQRLTCEPFSEWEYLRDENRLPLAGEILIDEAWQLAEPSTSDLVTQNAILEIRTFFSRVLKVNLCVEPSGKKITLLIDPSRVSKSPESFEINVRENSIKISAADPRGLLRAAFWLEDQMLLSRAPVLQQGSFQVDPRYGVRMVPGIYPAPNYFLMHEAQIWTPGYLWRLARAGYNAVYFQASIEDFVEDSDIFPELNDADAPNALERLRRCVEMGSAYGVDFYWDIKTGYEKKFPEAVYQRLPHLRSFRKFGNFPCTGQGETLRFIENTVRTVFTKVEKLKGIFLVYDTEGFYSCITHNHKEACPYCKDYTTEELFSRLYNAIRNGVRCIHPDRDLLMFTYICDEPWNYQLIQSMPTDATLIACYSQLKELDRFGTKILTDDYSLCSSEPSHYFLKVQSMAVQKGMRFFCKTEDTFAQEFVNTPYTPCLEQHQRRWDRLAQENVSGILAQYLHLGFMPTPCQDLMRLNAFETRKDGAVMTITPEQKVFQTAQMNYGEEAAPWVVKAWDAFSRAIREDYPYTWGVCRYPGPVQSAPGQPFYLDPQRKMARQWARGYVKDLGWTGIRSRFLLQGEWNSQVITRCMQSMLKHYDEGNANLLQALVHCNPLYRSRLAGDLRISQMQQSQIQTIVHLIAFYHLRDVYHSHPTPLLKEQIQLILNAELANAQNALRLAECDSRLGFSCEGDGNVRGGHFTPATIRAKIEDLCQTLEQLYSSTQT